jgi:hypothetical protein
MIDKKLQARNIGQNNIRKDIDHENRTKKKVFNLFSFVDNNICNFFGAFEIGPKEKNNLLMEKFNRPDKNHYFKIN